MTVFSDEIEAFSKSVASSLERLNALEKSVIELRFGLISEGPLTFELIGKRLHLSRGRVHQVAYQAARKLKTYWRLFPEHSELLFTDSFCYPVTSSESVNRINSLAVQNKPKRKARVCAVKRWKKEYSSARQREGPWNPISGGPWSLTIHNQKSIEIRVSILGRINKRLQFLGYRPEGRSMTNGVITLRTFQHLYDPSRIKLVSIISRPIQFPS